MARLAGRADPQPLHLPESILEPWRAVPAADNAARLQPVHPQPVDLWRADLQQQVQQRAVEAVALDAVIRLLDCRPSVLRKAGAMSSSPGIRSLEKKNGEVSLPDSIKAAVSRPAATLFSRASITDCWRIARTRASSSLIFRPGCRRWDRR
jgi:hypothetical protein